ncbi:MAG TPA: tRNA dihydrouridine synthase DusB [Thiotrichaceae bacterium]|jgi:tRNA-dihydrouridine synthase B|nr:tRNA dihydrouridine synthase DusB [Thiotrichaceae bacterium]HIM08559.1 tRNA dihydrouridine synthase DusB [Gammaproteobacteria bacterium]
MFIGTYILKNNLVLAPMAGVTDQPFRLLCRELGAGLVISEMVTSNPALFKTRKTQLRLNHTGEAEPRAIQIAGAVPEQMAEAAKFNVEHGAQIIDINMGCPAKKVCNLMAGSALLRDEQLVSNILTSVVNAVDVPVTLKIRTGWDKENRNALKIAQIAESSGIQALTIHGRTRACAFTGVAEHETAGEIKAKVGIPIIANGDITTPEKAAEILKTYNVDGIMIGRAAQGNPWIFREINHYLNTGEKLGLPDVKEICKVLIKHVSNLHEFYGEYQGVRIARKHIGWYCKQQNNANKFRAVVNQIESANEQLFALKHFFSEQQALAA